MRVVIKEPGKKANYKEIPNSLEALQETVGGYIETVSIRNVLVGIVDEEGRMKSKQYNIMGLVGTIVFCGIKGDKFTDVPENHRLFKLLEVNEKKGQRNEKH